MSDIFAFDQAGQQQMEEEARTNGVTPYEARRDLRSYEWERKFGRDHSNDHALLDSADHPIHSVFYHRVAQGTGMGVMRGGARVAQFLGMTGAALLEAGASATPVESVGPELVTQEDRDQANEQLLDGYFRKLDRNINSAVDFWTPRGNEVGAAGRILGGLAEVVLPLMATGGDPALLIGTQEMGAATDLVREGVSAPAAVGVGVVQGAATAVGFRLPFLGSSLAQRMGSGVAGNLAVGVGTALVSRGALNAAGEAEAAKGFDPLDIEARAVDVLTGAAFGGIAHVQMRSAERAAAITAANARHFQEQTAPGMPADLNASAAHQKAMEAATRQLLSGDTVRVGPRVTEVDFVPREFVAESLGERRGAVDEHLPGLDDTLRADAEAERVTASAPQAPSDFSASASGTNAQRLRDFVSRSAPQRTIEDERVSRILERNPELRIPAGAINADGVMTTRTVREALAEADAGIVEAETMGRGVMAAVNCVLQRGV